MSILLTGGLGFIGSHCVVELIKKYSVIIVDNLYNSTIDILDKIETITQQRPLFYQYDITDYHLLHKVFEENKIDAVIHLAGYKAVGESVSNPAKYYENNINGLLTLLKCMNEFNVKKIVFSSSATVYGQPSELPLSENAKINILNPYGQTKYMSELILQDYANAYQLSVIALRYFNPVGAHPSGILGENDEHASNLFPMIMSVYKHKKEYLEIYGNDYNTKDGTCIRDYIHVVDLALGHMKALNVLKPGFQVYNLGTGNGYTVLEIIKEFEKQTGKLLNYQYKNRRLGDSDIVYANCKKANDMLSWYPKYELCDMVKHLLKYN